MRTILVTVGCVACVACHDEKTGKVEGPPLTVASAPASASAAAAPASGPPVEAKFVDLSDKALTVPVGACREVFVTPVTAKAKVENKQTSADLKTGDVGAFKGEGGASAPDLSVTGEGVALVATARISPCDPPAGQGKTKGSIFLASGHSELTFMGGNMHAHLDVDGEAAYLGRLNGTASVPEHVHPGTWEILCAVQASGTFTLAGQDQHLGARQCVFVPPDTKHAWKPDAGSNLVAVQMYSPPGPEQRFKKLAEDWAAQKADAGAPKK